MNQTPLNRGISSLFDEDNGDYSEVIEVDFHQQSIPIELLYPNPDQPRKIFTAEKLEELTLSISQNGVLQPLLVRPHPSKSSAYEIIAGERRWQAATKAGLDQVPIIVKDLSDSEVIELALVENIHRHDLTVIEEAQGYKMLLEQFDYTQDRLAQMVSKSRSHVTNLLRLLKLPNSIQKMVNDNLLSAGHARALIGRENIEQWAKKIIDEGLSVRQTEMLFQSPRQESTDKDVRASASDEVSKQQSAIDPDLEQLQQQLSEQIDLPVSVVTKGEAGQVIIRFHSLDEFARLQGILARGSHNSPSRISGE